MFRLKEKSILIVSNEPWGDIWYSKHNWAYELSKNNNVFFINPPKRWNFFDLFSNKIEVKDFSSNLKVINYNNRIPLTRFDLLFQFNEFLVAKSLRKWFSLNGISRLVFWTFDPYRFSKPSLFSPIKSLFFRVDIFLLEKREKRLIKNVDGVIVTAQELLEGVEAKKKLVITHGISEEEFVPSKTVEYEQGYFLYVGNIDYRLDVKLIEKMLKAFPDEKFLFIGRKTDTKNELFDSIFNKGKYKNLILHGVEHFKKLKNYIHYSKACLVPMDLTVHGNAVHHHKTLQYLAMGKPIVSPVFNDEINQDQYIVGYTSHDEAIQKIKSLEDNETNQGAKNRIEYARQFTYKNLIQKVEEFL